MTNNTQSLNPIRRRNQRPFGADQVLAHSEPPGSNSRLPRARSLLSAATRCLREASCWSATRVQTGSCSPAEWALASQKKVLANLYGKFQKLKQSSCPFINLPEISKGRWGLGITPAVMKRCEWVKPLLVAQVKFTKWTHDNRQPVFLGSRTDKEAKNVVREEDKMP